MVPWAKWLFCRIFVEYLIPNVEMSFDSSKEIEKLVKSYSSGTTAIEVDFRALVRPAFENSGRLTHSIHPYTAKLLAQIPYFFLSSEIFSKRGDLILDPFCGSGTVLLESLIAGRNAMGADVNPLARIISRVKTTPLNKTNLGNSIERLYSRIPITAALPITLEEDYEYWFYPHILRQLARIFSGIKSTRNVYHRDFFLVCFSALLKKVSLADPRLSVPVRQRASHYPDGHPLREQAEIRLRRLKRINVFSEFWDIVENNKTRVEQLEEKIRGNVKVFDIAHDARLIGENNPRSKRRNVVDMIITSPPYSGAQKYTRATKLSLAWMSAIDNIHVSSVEDSCIGREHFRKSDYLTFPTTGISEADEFLLRTRKENELRAHISATYLIEMKDALTKACSLLKRGGYFVLVAGNNNVCGHEFMTVDFLAKTIESLGFSTILRVVDEIRSRGLMTKRNKTASLITREWVYVFEKS